VKTVAAAPARLLMRVALWVFAALFLAPLAWMVMSSFKSNREIFADPLSLPKAFDLGVWAEAWTVGNLGGYLVNSVIVTAASTTLILLVGAAAAFAFSRYRFPLQGFLLGMFALGLLVPLQSYFIAQDQLFNTLALKDTRWALILPYAAMGLPLAIYLMKAFLDGLPKGIFEAARIDGCGELRMFVRIVLPLLKPGLATVGIFSALSAWNEFLLALLYIQSDELKTIPTGLLAFTGRYMTDYQLLFSALTLVTLPMIAVYVIFNRQITAGLTAGSVH
jgi:raffinose/stachyose/melibiose transport system permease protein